MIYDQPANDAAIDQGDLIEGCPVIRLKAVPTGTNALEPVALHLEPDCRPNADLRFGKRQDGGCERC